MADSTLQGLPDPTGPVTDTDLVMVGQGTDPAAKAPISELPLANKAGSNLLPAASASPTADGQMVFELTNNTTLTIKVQGSDSVVRSATITLA